MPRPGTALTCQDEWAGKAVLPEVFAVVSKPSGTVLVKLTDHPSSLL